MIVNILILDILSAFWDLVATPGIFHILSSFRSWPNSCPYSDGTEGECGNIWHFTLGFHIRQYTVTH